jgi:hypothetical protein
MAGTRAQKYRPEIIEHLRKKLASLPEMTPKELTRTEVVRGLSKQIVALQKRGYAMKAIAEVISGEGVAVTGATLRGCLRGSRSNRRAVVRKRPGDASGDARVNGAATPRVMPWERARDISVNAARDAVVTNAEHVRDKSVDADVGVNRNCREPNVEERAYARGAPGNSAGNQAGAPPGMAGQTRVDASGDLEDAAAIYRGDTTGNRLEAEVRSHRWIDQPPPANSVVNANVDHRVASAATESRLGFAVREDTPEI